MRKAYPNCRIMAHEISWGGGNEKTSGVTDKAIEQRESQNTMNGLIAKRSGWSLEAINRITERRDFYMSAEQAMQLGFIDEVITPRKPEPAPQARREFPGWVCRKLENPRPFCP
jgi:ATP-dependent Clp protease protease subunit